MRQDSAAPHAERELVLELVRRQAGTGRGDLKALAARTNSSRLEAVLRDQRLLVTLGRHLGDLAPPALTSATATAQRRALLFEATTDWALRALEAAGVRAVTLKGVALSTDLFGDPGARDTTDVDLLVPWAELGAAAATLGTLGWTDPAVGVAPPPVPRLHRELVHPSLPPVELHWRVHWYEETFCAEALRRVTRERRLSPPDELVCLLLFMARDGFAGLRQATDVAAWWGTHGAAPNAAEAVRDAAVRHPHLAPALTAASIVAERILALPGGSLHGDRPHPGRAAALAIRLADPWLELPGQQLAAQISLADSLLAPRGGVGSALRRQLLPSRRTVLIGRPDLVNGPRYRSWAARILHLPRVLARYALALSRVRTAVASARP